MASILKRDGPPVRWLVGWREPGTKVQRWKSFSKLGDAKTFRDKTGAEIQEGTYIRHEAIPFATFAKDWLARRRGTVGPNTRALNEWAVEKYLIPAFGTTPLQNLTAEQIERWQADMLNRTMPGRRSVEICKTTLGTILKDACDKDKIRKNPLAKVRRFDLPKREMHHLTMEQVKALCAHVGRVYGVLFLVMAFCGLRIGEVLGLQWPDVKLDRGQLFIQRQVIWRAARHCKPGEPRWIITEPKSKAGIRVVEIPRVLVPFLTSHKEEQRTDLNPLALVFPSEDGTPLTPANTRRRHFQPALKALGLSGIRPHDFRRTFIAMHVEAGTHPKLVQERVGHSNIKLTMDVYGELAGTMPMPAEQVGRFNALAATALPAPADSL
jgi:integrase